MGMKHFSSDSRDCSCFGNLNQSYEPQEKLPNPNPKNFNIKNADVINGYSILLVNYPDCTNYEGNKILVFDKGFDIRILLANKKIDPHFYNMGDSPIARFEPTERGWNMAISFVTNYNQ